MFLSFYAMISLLEGHIQYTKSPVGKIVEKAAVCKECIFDNMALYF